MIVIQNSKPITRWVMANSHPKKISQMMLKIKPPAPKWPSSISLPKGHNTKPAILKHCIPNGIPSTVTHKSRPDKNHKTDAISPPNSSQMMLPIKFIVFQITWLQGVFCFSLPFSSFPLATLTTIIHRYICLCSRY